jgi:hypothetical protein
MTYKDPGAYPKTDPKQGKSPAYALASSQKQRGHKEQVSYCHVFSLFHLTFLA